MSVEEGQRLLSNQALEDDSEEDEVLFTTPHNNVPPPSSSSAVHASPPPLYSSPQAATLTLTEPPRPVGCRPPEVSAPFILGGAVAPIPANEAPPDYSLHAPKGESYPVKKAGMAVHIQIDGRLVPGTVMEDASGRHMVYICQPARTLPSDVPESTEKPPCPKDYFFLALISLLCCCAPLGVFALVKSLEVHRLYKRGDYAGAARASKQAHSWGSAAVVFGATMVIIIFALKIYFSEYDQNTHYYYYQ